MDSDTRGKNKIGFESDYAKDEMGPLVVDDEPEQEVVTKRELWGWYLYGWASEPFNVMMAGVFYPIVLESLSSAAGYEADGITPCNTTVLDYTCYAKFGGSLVDTTSYALYVTTIAVLIQFIVFVTVGAVADHGNLRKRFLLIFAYLGVISSICYVAVTKASLYNVVAFLQIFSTVTYGASIVFWYAYLPTLTRNHPTVVAARQNSNLSPKEVAAVAEHMGNAVSGHGFAVGYAGGIVALVIGALILIFMGQATYNMQIAIAFGGVWWGLFTIFTISWTKPRPGPPLPAGENYWFYSWKRVIHTVSQARRLSESFKFLISWFLLSDGVNTVFYIALFYAKKDVGMTNSELIIAALIIPVCAIAGVYIFNAIQRVFRIPTKTMILIVSASYCILPIWGLIGFLTPNFGLKSKSEIYAASALDGLLLGPIQSFCRVLFSELLPAGHENEFFALYEITDKGSSWLGPLVIGGINSAGHSLRTGFWWVFATLVTPVLVICFVNVEKGKREAHQFSEAEKKKVLAEDRSPASPA